MLVADGDAAGAAVAVGFPQEEQNAASAGISFPQFMQYGKAKVSLSFNMAFHYICIPRPIADDTELVEIRKLPADRWRDFRELRLEALKRDPSAYGSSFEEEEKLKEDEWKRRTKSVLFALSDDRPVGMIVYVFNKELKARHAAEIYGFYVNADHRGEGVGTRLLERALSLIRRNKKIIKVSLAVNPEQRAAVRMYRKAGFVVSGRTEKELKVGRRFYAMLFMEKWL